ncbi:dTDP-4-dehydrorhamnose reductase [Pseudomonas sp. CAN2814]|uniref:dTDP-4-dehydrorhamnose reductase n=1 Tax=Pseudomonas sp. CAN1 TaxID=3046726 RepID=UPI00264A2249|nr:dTDP-4-dehydrorhamnose reductase [Pseudomonas sp. CAN1]MDN6856446.1 dTDP-4-dehydrorhamnose reductase [Pseudomonas sp. CAN1]
MNKILLLGANGQVGWELQRSLAPLAQLTICDRQHADLSDLAGLKQLIVDEQPDVIVNAAAYTAVDKAESDMVAARRINAEAVALIASVAQEQNALFVHYSTDYVFDGSGDVPFSEQAATGPLSVYGQTKLEGEIAIRESGCSHLILRTSWVFAARGANFAKTMLRLAKERDALNVIADQFGAPTSAELIADVTAHILKHLAAAPATLREAAGTYHLVASGETSWHGYARFVIEEAGQLGCELRTRAENIAPITTSQYPLPAQRPANSRLSNDKLQNTFDLKLPPWEFHVRRMIRELVDQDAI